MNYADIERGLNELGDKVCHMCDISANIAQMYSLELLTVSPPIPLRLYTLLYWSNLPFLIFDIRALWRSGLSARAPECQKLKMVG